MMLILKNKLYRKSMNYTLDVPRKAEKWMID